MKALKGFVRKNNNINQPDPPELQRVHMEKSKARATYEVEDGLVWHQWQDRPLVLCTLRATVYRNTIMGKLEWVGEPPHRSRGRRKG